MIQYSSHGWLMRLELIFMISSTNKIVLCWKSTGTMHKMAAASMTAALPRMVLRYLLICCSWDSALLKVIRKLKETVDD